MDKKPSGLIMFLLAALVATFFMRGCPSSATTPPPQSLAVMEGGESQITGQGYDTTVTINGATFAPQFTELPALTDGSQWLLVYWWENHEINNEGLGIDMGFFVPADGSGSPILMARCFDPTWKNPTPGSTVYTYVASEGLLKVFSDETLQRFLPGNTVLNPAVPTATPTQVIQPTATGTLPSQGVLPQTPVAPGTGSQFTITWRTCLTMLAVLVLAIGGFIAFARIRNR